MKLGEPLSRPFIHSLTHLAKAYSPVWWWCEPQAARPQPGGRESLVDTALLPVTTPPRESHFQVLHPHLLAHRAPPPVRLGEAFRALRVLGLQQLKGCKPTEREEGLEHHSSGLVTICITTALMMSDQGPRAFTDLCARLHTWAQGPHPSQAAVSVRGTSSISSLWFPLTGPGWEWQKESLAC